MGNLISATLDSDIIWTGTGGSPSAMLSPLTGTDAYKTISGGQTKTLWFNFQGTPGQIIGNNVIRTHAVAPGAGQARAYPFTASASGIANVFNLYFDDGNKATSVSVGIYSSGGSNPATLLSTGSLTGTPKATWRAISITPVSLTSGTQYWLAVLSPSASGTVKFRDKSGGTSKRSYSSTLSQLPDTWTSGTTYSFSDMSAYLTGYVSGGSTPSDYSIRVNFDCDSYIGYPSIPTCSITGPDTVCTASSYWHNASVTDEDSRYSYTYSWKVDSNNTGSGKSVHVNWSGYSDGLHALNVTQTEMYGSTTTYTAGITAPYIFKDVFVIEKPTPVINIDP